LRTLPGRRQAAGGTPNAPHRCQGWTSQDGTPGGRALSSEGPHGLTRAPNSSPTARTVSSPVILRNLSNPGSKNAFATSACDRREDPSSLHALRSSREIHETVYWQFRGRPPPNRRFDWASARIAIPRVQLPFGLVANFMDAGVIRALVL